jgi:putative transcription factor
MEGQDWTPVVFKKSAPTTAKDAKGRGGYQVSGKAKVTQSGGRDGQRMAKIDRTEIGNLPKVSRSVSKAISQGRLAKKISQKELAQSCNVKPEVIAQYEKGKAQPNQSVLLKMQRKLGVHLTGKLVGESIST